MKKICVVTATRAEYGLLRNLIKVINEDSELELCLVVTGTHLEAKYGDTIQEIVADGFPIEKKIPIISAEDNECGIIQTMSTALDAFGQLFLKKQPDMLIVLGDRYELLPICEAAMICKIPIAHISGGEITEGAIDDSIRHCITKMSHLHFPGCETYRRRIVQMGEHPDRVFNYGDVGVENIVKMNFIEKKELEKSIHFDLDKPYACVTFHPATLDKELPEVQIHELLDAIDCFPDMKFIFTGSNADSGGKIINDTIEKFVREHENCRLFASLGIQRYLSLLRESEMVIGNSSSGIVEAPCFGIPTINIGSRQKGRLQADSIINCETKKKDIIEAIKKGRTKEFKEIAFHAVNPYGAGNTSELIVKEIKTFLDKEKETTKRFYDIEQISY